MKNETIIINGKNLTIELVSLYLKNKLKIKIDPDAEEKVNKCRNLIENWIAEDRIIYGVTTGFGEFANVKISSRDNYKLQENLIISHSAGVGDPLPPEIVRVMMLLRINALAGGNSGIRLETLEKLAAMANRDIIPVIPSQGSVGSSGDLAPLSHLALALIGKGKVKVTKTNDYEDFIRAETRDSGEVLNEYGIEPVKLAAKEGLALINGTQMMTAFAAIIAGKAAQLVKIADIAASMSHEALRASDRPFDSRIQNLRRYPGQKEAAANVLKLIKNSEIRRSHLTNDPRVQDSYSIRCIPQIHGAVRNALRHVREMVSIEINSVNDNPLIFPEDETFLEGGNFHGEPVALVMDYLGIAISELASVSERRTERMLNGSLSMLPRFLTKNGGLNSGFMIAQYTSAALVSENKVLAHPASVDSIPTSANQEDHNSMGSIAARKCYSILKNVQRVLAIELLTAAQGIEFLKPLSCGDGTSAAYNFIRNHIKPLEDDRIIHKDMDMMYNLVDDGTLLEAVENAVRLE